MKLVNLINKQRKGERKGERKIERKGEEINLRD